MHIIIDNIYDEPAVIFESPDENDYTTNKKYTHFCKAWFETQECNNKKCTFAHSVEELRRKVCMRDARCRNDKCIFKHTGQSDEDFLERNKLVHRVQKNQIKSAVITVPSNKKGAARDAYILEAVRIAEVTGRKALTFVFEG